MTLAKVFLQIGQGLDEEIAKAGRTLNAAIASSLSNLVTSNSPGIPVRRGPKPKAVVTAPVVQRAKPGPKPKAKPTAVAKTAKPVKAVTKAPKATKPAKVTNGNASVSAGRRAVANGDRPKAVDALATVMGNNTMKAADVVAGLAARGWLPNTDKPQNYISFLLSSNPDIFERVSRGEYKVVKGANLGKAKRASSSENGSSAEPVAAQNAPVASGPTSKELDEDLVALGVGETSEIAGNPFHA